MHKHPLTQNVAAPMLKQEPGGSSPTGPAVRLLQPPPLGQTGVTKTLGLPDPVTLPPASWLHKLPRTLPTLSAESEWLVLHHPGEKFEGRESCGSRRWANLGGRVYSQSP